MSVAITISVSVPDELAQQLPAERQRVLELGLRQWRIRQALEAFKRGEGSYPVNLDLMRTFAR